MKSSMAGDIAWGVVTTCLLITLALVFPLVGFCFIPFVPVPTLFYRCKLGRNPSFILMLAAMTILTVFTGQMGFDSIMIGLLLLTGYFLGEQFQKQQSVDETITKSCVQALGAGAVGAFGFSLISETTLGDAVRGFVRQNLELTLRIYKDAGVAQETIDAIAGAQETIELILVRLLPAFIEWSPGPHPSTGQQDVGLRLDAIRLTHPDPARLRELLRTLGVDHLAEIREGQKGLAFVVTTPKGQITLD